MKKLWHIYIMTNKPNGVIYIGVTDNIDERVKFRISIVDKIMQARKFGKYSD